MAEADLRLQAVRCHKVIVGHQQLRRVRRICSALPGTTERVSHGEPTFFDHGKVYAMFANDHHHEGHIAVWIPAPPGSQAGLIKSSPKTFFKPPYVGGRGWVGVELSRITGDDLRFHIHMAWEGRLLRGILSPRGSNDPRPHSS